MKPGWLSVKGDGSKEKELSVQVARRKKGCRGCQQWKAVNARAREKERSEKESWTWWWLPSILRQEGAGRSEVRKLVSYSYLPQHLTSAWVPGDETLAQSGGEWSIGKYSPARACPILGILSLYLRMVVFVSRSKQDGFWVYHAWDGDAALLLCLPTHRWDQ
jgi:hypothetical protein